MGIGGLLSFVGLAIELLMAGSQAADRAGFQLSASGSKIPIIRNQYPSLEGIKIVIDSLGERGKDAKPADFMDMSFVRELEDSGFVSGLYRQR